MDFEAIPLDNKKLCAGQHQKNFGIFKNEHALQNRKMRLGNQ